MKKTYFRKTMSIFLAVLMLLSCWVFVAPEQASALGASYPVKIKFTINTSGTTGHINVYYFPFKADGSGFDTSDTGTYTTVINSFYNDGYYNAGTYTAGPFNVPGYPWKVEIRVDSSNTVRFYGFYINDIEVTGMVANNNEGYNINGKITKHWAYNDNTNLSSGSIANKNWSVSVPTNITTMADISSVTIPKIGTGSTYYYTRTATVTDQYGVTWPAPATYTLSKTVSVNGGAPGTGVTYDVGGSDYPNGARVYITEDAQKLITNTSTSTYYLIATSGNLSTYSTITLTHPTYTVTFNDAQGDVLQTSDHVYGASVTPPSNPSKASDSRYHYAFLAWDSTEYTSVPGDLVINPTYTSTIHSFTGDYVNNGDGTHSRKCTGCSMTGIGVTGGTSEACRGTWSGNDSSHSRTCRICSNTDTHTPDFVEAVADEYIKVEQSCTNAGEYYKSCSICGLKHSTETFIGSDATGHSYTIEKSTTKHTCLTDGYVTYECDVCGDTYDEYYVKNADGSYAVDTNGEKILSDPAAHTWADTISDKDDGTHGKICTVCGNVWTEESAHTWTLANTDSEPTCTEDGIGDYACECGATMENAAIPATGHLNTEEKAQQDSTCTQVGYTAGVYCADCDTWLSGHEEIEKTEHTLTETAANAATCETAGNSAYWTCEVCNNLFSDAEGTTETTLDKTVIAALEHNYTSEVTTEATCISAGVRTYTCQNDTTHFYTETIPATGEHIYGNWSDYGSSGHQGRCTDDISCTAVTVEAHSFTGDVRAYNATYHDFKCEKCSAYGTPTGGYNYKEACYDAGETYTKLDENSHTAYCICGNTLTQAHSWDWTADGNTTDNTGTMTGACEKCGETKISDCNYAVTDSKDAACTANGYKTWTCADCGNGYTEILTSNGHSWTEKGDYLKTAGTCTDEAVYYFGCANCDAVADDTVANGTYETEKDAENHVGNTALRDSKTANCHEKGYTGDTYCLGCGEKIETGTETAINSNNHDGKTEVREAVTGNCHTEGYTGDTWCLGCDTKIAYGTSTGLDSSNHDGKTEIRDSVTGNCHTAGYTGDTWCLGCDTKIEDGTSTGLDSSNHDGETEVREEVTGNCHTEGYTGDTYCLGCETKIEDGESTGLDTENHDGETEVRDTVTGNCHTAGYTGDTWCLGCDTKIADGTSTGLDSSNHDGETEVREEVTGNCHTEGYTGDTYCLGCDTKIADGKSTGVDTDNHDGETEVRDTVTGNCHTEGYIGDTYCLGCDTKIEDGESTGLDTENHDGETEVRDAVTGNCHTESYTGDTWCLGCDTKIEDGESTGLDLSNHDGETEVRDSVTGNCHTAGYTGDTWCLGCETKIADGESTGLDTENHDGETEVRDAVTGNCHTAGYTGDTWCLGCETKIADGESTGLDSSNHDGETEVRDAVTGNCHTEGYTGNTYCLGCETKIEDGESTGLDAENHDGDTEVRDSVTGNCHAEGYTGDTYCLGCETKIADGESTGLNTENHDGETEIRDAKTASCNEKGYTGDTYCLGCGEKLATGKETSVTPQNHTGSWVTVPEKKATCLEKGHSEYRYCVSCGATEGKTVIEAIGHNDENGDGKCDECTHSLLNVDQCGCICHKDHLLMRLLYRILRFFWKLFGIGRDCLCGYTHY